MTSRYSVQTAKQTRVQLSSANPHLAPENRSISGGASFVDCVFIKKKNGKIHHIKKIYIDSKLC